MKTVIFDFDGTLADTLQLTVSVFNQVADKHHLPQIKASDLETVRGLSARELVTKYAITPLRLLRLITDMQSLLKKRTAEIDVIAGIPALLQHLHQQGIQVGIVTSNSRAVVDAFVKRHHFNTIDFIHCEKNLFGKGRVLKHVLKKQHLLPRDVWYVGDEVRDIDAAHQAGLKVIAVTWGFNTAARLQKAQPDVVIKYPAQLLDVLVATKT